MVLIKVQESIDTPNSTTCCFALSGEQVDFLGNGLADRWSRIGADANRKIKDCPSIRMWVEYFPNAEIHGLDVSDFSWFSHERFTFHRCDMEDRADIAQVAGTFKSGPDIVIDDASHASHHQQNAFLEFFPRMPSRSLYIIEDLRWQPPAYEKKITKTAALFRSDQNDLRFSHSDAETEAALNALAKDISACIIEPVRCQKKRRDQLLVVHKR